VQVNIFDIAVCRIIHYYFKSLAIPTMTRPEVNQRINSWTATTKSNMPSKNYTEVTKWLNSSKIANFKLPVEDREFERVISVRKDLDVYSIKHQIFSKRAIDFARSMRTNNVSSLVSFLNFFVTMFVKERDTEQTGQNSNNKIAGIDFSEF